MKKKITFLLLMIFASANIYSQNFTITFDASGAATTLDSVKIINLTHPDTAMWHDGDIFQLQFNNAINDIETNKENLLIFPNPMQGMAEIMFNVKQAGIASINIYEITGKEIIHSDENLSQGNHQFQLTGLKQGAYFINIRGNGYFYSSKLISYNSFSNDINLKYNRVIQETNTNKYKTTNSSINFSFVSGDILQYTGYAANLTAVVTNSPISDITVTFNFIASIPSVTTNAATTITNYTAICGGNVTSDGGEIVTARGICYATTANPTIANNIVSGGGGTGLFTANLTGLNPGTTYYVRAYATNSVGTAYGNEVIFTTLPLSLPVLTTTNISSITSNTAISGGNITSDGGAFVSVRGVCWSTSPNPTIALSTKTTNGSGTGIFTSNINGLTAGTTYYVRAYATNSAGTAYGNELSFITIPASLPVITTTNVSTISFTNTTSGGNISTDGGAIVTVRGVCWNTSPNPTIALSTKTTNGADTGSFTSNISGLTTGTTYYVRAYATNIVGTAYGNDISFTTLIPSIGTVIDYDDNVYDTVHINTQIWMKQNLKTTHYKNGTAIPNITDSTTWGGLSTGARCYYNNDSVTYPNTYGALYNWYAVCTGNLCPTGWNVPSDAEWTTLITYLGGIAIAGGKLKEAGLAHWNSPNTGATNETGFTALPGGRRLNSGAYGYIGDYGHWWSSTEFSTASAWSRYMTSDYSDAYGYVNNNPYGFSVRCIKDLSSPSYLPSLTTTTASAISLTTATTGGNISSDGGAAITARGVCWSTTPNPTVALSTISYHGSGAGSFISYITGLNAGTTYFVRAFATNSAGTAYGNEVIFTTIPASLPVLTTANVSSITSNTAISGGNITSDGGASVIARGVCWSTVPNPHIGLNTKTINGIGIGSFTSNITGLAAGTTYYVRAYATNSLGTAYGNELSFTTLLTSLPVLTTTNISSITDTSATSGGNICSDGGDYVTARGVCWSTSQNPTIALSTKTTNGADTGSYVSVITGLTYGTTYYVRAYATNSIGTAYGNGISFTTPFPVYDIDGNGYDTVHIGNQIWMKQNLKTIHYKNGIGIAYPGTDNTAWQNNTSGAYAWYNTASTYINTYGALYNWYAVNTGNLCPTGWHVPSDAEWTTLTTYLGGETIAGGKLKEAGIAHWNSPNTAATNETGFTALPGGFRGPNSNNIKNTGYFWSSTELSTSNALYRYMSKDSSTAFIYNGNKTSGLSVRCLKN